MKDTQNSRINCLKCAHFAITWDPRLPRACKLFGFRTAGYPSATVQEATGAPCQGFVPKAGHKGG